MPDRSDCERRHRPRVRLAVLVAVVLLAGARLAAAQSVTVPTFPVHTAGAGRTTLTVDLAEGADDSVLFAWDERVSSGGFGYQGAWARFAQDGTPILPVPPAPPPGFACCSKREFLPRLAAYASGGYALLRMVGYTNDVGYVGWELDPLGALLPGGGWQVDSVGTHLAGHGGASATLDDLSIHLVWDDQTASVVGRRLNASPGLGGGPVIAGSSDPEPFIDLVAVPPDRIVAGWGSVAGSLPRAMAVFLDPIGVPGPLLTLSVDTSLRSLVLSRRGDRLGLVGTRAVGGAVQNEIWGRIFTRDGVPLGADFQIYAAPTGVAVAPDAAFDFSDGLYVAWVEGGSALRAIGVAADGSLGGSPVTLASGAFAGEGVRTIRLADPNLHDTGRFMNAWTDGTGVRANVASVCTPGTASCGDGVRVPFCEICDDGAVNDDAAPDACRTDCRPARCGDTVIDSGETCDDGNLTPCDGCDATCQTEVALGCGNGLALPGCGEQCDDGNLGDGDGCSPTCQNELISGGGSAKSDCLTAWSVDNPSNTPRLGSDGSFNRKQRCSDNDPACDFDGGAVGSCTFQLRVCGNVTALASCVPSPRLATWKLDRPSERDAQKSAVAAAVLEALTGSVPGAIVGPRGTDLCSATVSVVVPLGGHSGHFRAGKRSLRTTAQDYPGTKDVDKLDLRCLPSP